jgi:hypothetical protein
VYELFKKLTEQNVFAIAGILLIIRDSQLISLTNYPFNNNPTLKSICHQSCHPNQELLIPN